MNGSAILTAVLPAREGSLGHLDAPSKGRKPILVVRCRQHEVQAFVLFDKPVSSTDRPVRTLWQVDDQPVQAKLSALSPDHSAFGAFGTADSKPIVDQLAAGARLTVRMESERGETATGVFDLSGTEAALQPVRGACR